ncbi:MAG: hypothetical protein JWP00_932 [Chloroflexi bacterium]|nr:hypothetical protein [Chloroflexota bacterium]
MPVFLFYSNRVNYYFYNFFNVTHNMWINIYIWWIRAIYCRQTGVYLCLFYG